MRFSGRTGILVAAMISSAMGTATKAFVPSLQGWASNSVRVALRSPITASREGRGLSSLKAAQSPAELVNSAIKSNPVVVFSKTWCPFCLKAKGALDSVGAKYEVIELDKRDDGPEIQDVFVDLTGARSVPRVFIGGKFIGGGDDTVRLAASGELKKLVQDAGALK